jgi:hypothetical protein
MTNKEPFYLRELHLPRQNSFHVADFLFALAQSTIPRCPECDQLSVLHRQPVICPRCRMHVERQRRYLIMQMMNAYNAKTIRLIDWTLSVWSQGLWETYEDYQFAFSSSHILAPDAERFCEMENTKLVLEDLETQTNTPSDIPPQTNEPNSNFQDDEACGAAPLNTSQGGSPSYKAPATNEKNSVEGDIGPADQSAGQQEGHDSPETEELANYRELAEVVLLNCMDEDQRIKWFKERCSNLKKYPKFGDAVRERSSRGRKPARFSVLAIAWMLLKDDSMSETRLIKGLSKRFPKTADLLSERFEEFPNP